MGLAFCLLFVFAPFDPEPHHDGYQIAVAVGVSEGRQVHTEVFSQYGPMTAWIHASVLTIFGPTLLALRYFTAIVLVASALLGYQIARQVGISSGLSAYLMGTYVLLIPVWSVGSGYFGLWPWPSVIFLLFFLLSVSLALRAAKSSGRSWWVWLASGVFMGLATVTRLNYGAITSIALVLGVLFVTTDNFKTKTRQLLAVISGGLVPGAVLLLILIVSGSFSAFLTDAIFGPLEGTQGAVAFDGQRTITILFIAGLPLVLAAIVAGYAQRKLRPLVAWLVVGTLSFTLLFISLAGTGTRLKGLWSDFANVTVVATFFELQPIAPLYVLLVVSALFLVSILKNRHAIPSEGNSKDQGTSEWRLLGFTLWMAVAAWVQLYPLLDPYHVWWAGPLTLIAAAKFLQLASAPHVTTSVVMVLLAPFVLTAIFNAYVQSSQDRTQFGTGVLKGMEIRNEYRKAFESLDSVLRSTKGEKSRFLCNDGLLAVWTGTFSSVDREFVGWAFPNDAPDSGKEANVVILCDHGSGEKFSGKLANRRSEPLTLSNQSNFTVYVNRQR